MESGAAADPRPALLAESTLATVGQRTALTP